MSSAKFDGSKNLGGFYPYCCKGSGEEKHFHPDIDSLLSKENCKKVLDELAILQVLNRYFMFGDRTIFRDIERTPWMARPESVKENSWLFHDLPPHGKDDRKAEPDIAATLFELLCKEIKIYTKHRRRVGILLSGGMDSRIVAAVLHHLMESKDIAAESVTAYTWGIDDCRDVVYSRRIAEMFGWEWKHFRVEAEDLWENFKIAGERGCEYSGLHLHAIPQISINIASEVDVMLAGSYGDSVGRAEYSGKKVTDLSPIQHKMRNPSFLLKSSVSNRIKNRWMEDVEKYHKLFPRDEQYQQRELDYQLHYMRRMLSPCMELINEKVEMHQAFTHPDVFGFMWSLHPDLRNDRIYEHLLDKVNPELLTIPWARTGLRYPLKHGEPDSYRKNHHTYSAFIQEDLIERIESRLTGVEAFCDGIFNEDAIQSILLQIRKRKDYNFDYLEKIAWLVSFSYLYHRFKIDVQERPQASLTDLLSAKILVPAEYRLRHAYRKFRK